MVWHPLGLAHMPGESLAAAGLAFAAAYQVDILRLASQDAFPFPAQLSLDRPHDLTRIDEVSGQSKAWLPRLVAFQEIRRLAGKKLFACESIPNPWSVLRRQGALELARKTGREHPSYLAHALEALTASLCNYTRAVIEAGATAVAFEIEGPGHDLMTPEEYGELGLPYDQRLLEAASGAEFRILQVRGSRLYLEPFMGLPAEFLQWSMANGPSLEKVAHQWPGKIMGGLDETRLASMSYLELQRHVGDVVHSPVHVVAPGDALPATIAPRQLEAIRDYIIRVWV